MHSETNSTGNGSRMEPVHQKGEKELRLEEKPAELPSEGERYL